MMVKPGQVIVRSDSSGQLLSHLVEGATLEVCAPGTRCLLRPLRASRQAGLMATQRSLAGSAVADAPEACKPDARPELRGQGPGRISEAEATRRDARNPGAPGPGRMREAEASGRGQNPQGLPGPRTACPIEATHVGMVGSSMME